MTTQQLTADFRAAALSNGRYDLMVGEYRYPLTVYLDGIPHLLQGVSDAWAFFQTMHTATLGEGYQRLTARVEREEAPKTGRFRVWVSWIAEGAERPTASVARTTLYCVDEGPRTAIEMIEFTELALPLLRV
ncbi:MAG: hypothetical protein MUD11_07930 [Rhodobacteraceae bacterium]|nr:hypothetical protein [Paracoccaceae bacterium]